MLRAEVERLLRRLVRRAGACAGGDQPDGVLLERFAHGRDEGAFAALVGRHGSLVFGVCRRTLGHHQDAEDAFQATFLILARRAAALRHVGSLASWLHTVAYRLALRARADAARRPTTEPRDLDMLPAPPDRAAAWPELRPILDEELQRLPEKYRAAVALCYLEGHTVAEASRQLGWPVGTVAGRLARAQALLRDRLERRGVTLSAGLLTAALAEHTRAAVPAALTRLTIRSAVAFAGTSAAAGISAKVAALAEGGLQAMFAAKVKMGVLVLTLLLVASGAGLWAQQVLSEQPAPEQPPAEARRAKADEQKSPVRLDLHGDALPPDALARLGTVRFRHGSAVRGVAYSQDGTKVISTSFHDVSIWDAATSRPLDLFSDFLQGSTTFAVSPDHKTVAATTKDGAIEVWDLGTHKKLRSWETPSAAFPQEEQRAIRLIGFSPSGRLLATAGGGMVRLWNPASGEQLREWNVAVFAWSLPVSPDDRLIALADRDQTLRVCDTATGKEIWSIKSDAPLVNVYFSPDGKVLAGTVSVAKNLESHAARLWETATGRDLGRLNKGVQTRYAVFAPDGKTLVTTGDDPWWQDITDTGREASLQASKRLRLLELATGNVLREWQSPSEVLGLAFSPDGKKLVTVGGIVRQWVVATGQELSQPGGHQAPITSLTLSADGRLVASASRDRTVRVWEAFSGKQLHCLENMAEFGQENMAFSPDSKLLVTSGFYRGIGIWDTHTGKEVRTIGLAAKQRVSWVGLSPDGKLLAACVYGPTNLRSEVTLYELATGKPLRTLEGVKSSLKSVTFTQDGRSVWALSLDVEAGEYAAHCWDVATGKETRRVRVGDHVSGKPGYEIPEAAFSPDGRWFARTAYDLPGDEEKRSLRLWDLRSGAEVRSLLKAGQWVRSPAFSADGRYLAAMAHDGEVVRWEVATGRERRPLRGHRLGHVYLPALTFSADGTLLASGSSDTVGYLWDLGGRLNPIKGLLSAMELESHWTTLLGEDAIRAEQAILTLAARPQESLPLLASRLRAVRAADLATTGRLIADLDSSRFASREQAAAELEKLGESALPAVRKALDTNPTAEVRRRLEAVRENVERATLALLGERLRKTRALEILERIGSPAARAVLETVAKGLQEASLTGEAKAALRRLAGRPATEP